MSVDQPGPAPADAEEDAPGDGERQSAAHGARVNAPRAAGPRKTPRPDRPEGASDPALRAARPKGRPATLPPPGFAGAVRSDEAEDQDEDTEAVPAVPATNRRATDPGRRTGDQPARPEPPAREEATGAVVPVTVKRRGRRGRRVKRVIRRIDLWSVLKLSLVVYACIYAAVMGTLAAVWGLAYKTGTIDKLESFLADVGMKDFHFYGDRMFKAVAAIGAVGVLSFTVITVLATALVNVISELTGGIRLTVIEEDV